MCVQCHTVQNMVRYVHGTLVRDGTLGLYVCTVSSSTWLGCTSVYLNTGWDIRIVCVYSVVQYMVGYVPWCIEDLIMVAMATLIF